MKSAILTYFTLICVSVISCTSVENKDNNKLDSNKILVYSLEYILKQKVMPSSGLELPSEYYSQPLQIIEPRVFKINTTVTVNNNRCILLPEDTKPRDVMKGMDIFNPIPLVEINSFNALKNIIKIDLIFRSTGNYFHVTLKQNKDKKYSVIKLVDDQI